MESKSQNTELGDYNSFSDLFAIFSQDMTV